MVRHDADSGRDDEYKAFDNVQIGQRTQDLGRFDWADLDSRYVCLNKSRAVSLSSPNANHAIQPAWHIAKSLAFGQ